MSTIHDANKEREEEDRGRNREGRRNRLRELRNEDEPSVSGENLQNLNKVIKSDNICITILKFLIFIIHPSYTNENPGFEAFRKYLELKETLHL